MCDISEGFKLCTCDHVDLGHSHWKLLRFQGEQNIILGTPNFDKVKDILDMQFVEDELNDRNCFDFDYSPQAGDRLIIKVMKENKSIDLCYDFKDDQYHKGWKNTLLYSNTGSKEIEIGKVE